MNKVDFIEERKIMKTYLITGSTGYLAKALIRVLVKNNKVIALCRYNNDLIEFCDERNFKSFEVEMRNYKNVFDYIGDVKIDVVYSFAWQGAYGKDNKNYEIQLNNAKYTCDLFIECQNKNVDKFIFISTFNTLEINNVLENENLARPSCCYGGGKLVTEIMCKAIASSGKMKYMSAIVPTAFGEGCNLKSVIYIIIKSIICGEELKLVEGKTLYDFVYVDDVVEGLLAINECGVNMNRYYIGHNCDKTFKEYVCEIRDILNPNFILEFGSYGGETLIDFDSIDRDRLYKHTGFVVSDDFKSQILKTADWIRKELK